MYVFLLGVYIPQSETLGHRARASVHFLDESVAGTWRLGGSRPCIFTSHFQSLGLWSFLPEVLDVHGPHG